MRWTYSCLVLALVDTQIFISSPESGGEGMYKVICIPYATTPKSAAAALSTSKTTLSRS